MLLKNILVVDDDPDQAELLALVLSTEHRQVHAYSDPFRALAVLAEEGVDLLIADLSMPWIDGKDIILKARERCPDLKIFLISGYARGADIAAREGFRFFAKPLDFETLRGAVEEAFAT